MKNSTTNTFEIYIYANLKSSAHRKPLGGSRLKSYLCKRQLLKRKKTPQVNKHTQNESSTKHHTHTPKVHKLKAQEEIEKKYPLG